MTHFVRFASLLLLIVLIGSNSSVTAQPLQSGSGFIAHYGDTLPHSLRSLRGQHHTLSFGNYFFIEEETLSPQQRKNIANDNVTLEPNITYHDDTNDTYWKNQWALLNTGSNNWAKGPAGEDIDARGAWAITKGSKSVVVAVIDSGVMLDHPDLVDTLFRNTLEAEGEPGIDDDNNGYVDDIHGFDFPHMDAIVDDKRGHGTTVSGVIAARHNQIGLAGVMDQVSLLPLKFSTATSNGDLKSALLAFDYAIHMGAHVINCSWSSPENSEALYAAIAAAGEHKIIVVATAGNRRQDIDAMPVYPASYDLANIVVVGATNGVGKKASFSSYGRESVTLFAPGTLTVTTRNNGKYTWKSGTSLAAPLVSGALGLSIAANPEMGLRARIQRLIDTTDPHPDLSDKAQGGRLNMARLLQP